MVTERVSDGKRIAQLLASELAGLETGTLDGVSVSDADTDAVPSESGTFAYRITGDDELATVRLYLTYAELSFSVEPAETASRLELSGDPATVAVTNGAVVKDAVDLVRETVAKHS
jgi:hypothetical protein